MTGTRGSPTPSLLRKKVPFDLIIIASPIPSLWKSSKPDAVVSTIWRRFSRRVYSTAPKLSALEDGLRDHLRVGPDPVAPLSVKQHWLSQIWFQLGEKKKLQVAAAEPAMSRYFGIEQPTARRGRRPTGRTPPAVFFLEAQDASARHPPDRTRPPLHPPLAPTAATPRLHSKYQSPGTHLRETVQRRAPLGQIVVCGCVEDQRMSGWSR